jgi:hypothetical protein
MNCGWCWDRSPAPVRLCTTLERFRLTCQPTIFAGRHLTLD